MSRGADVDGAVRRRPDVGAVLLDLDGTLVDSEKLILSSYRHTLRTHRGEAPSDEAWLETMGTPLLVQLRDFARDEEQARAMMETYLEHNRRVHDDMIRAFPGAREAVEALRGAGYPLGIVTSKRRDNALKGLAVCGFERRWFGSIVAATDLEEHKPHPRPVLRALEELGEEPGRAVFVGDSIHDLRAGRAAGTRTAAALWGPYDRERLAAGEPDLWLERPEELVEVLDASGGTAAAG